MLFAAQILTIAIDTLVPAAVKKLKVLPIFGGLSEVKICWIVFAKEIFIVTPQTTKPLQIFHQNIFV